MTKIYLLINTGFVDNRLHCERSLFIYLTMYYCMHVLEGHHKQACQSTQT